jgi:hypothetical protein
MFGADEPTLRPLSPAHVARAKELRAAVDPVSLRHSLEVLPAPRIRTHLPADMAIVDQLIVDAFGFAGWQAELRGFQTNAAWSWTSASAGTGVRNVGALAGVNVVGVKEGELPDALVVVAHHDTVPGTGGADDNGSGLVALMELARLLGPVTLRRSVVLAAVDHEELGFWGSRQLVSELTAERPVVGALVYEMLAYVSRVPGAQQMPPGIGGVYGQQVSKLRARELRGDFLALIYQQQARALAACFAECLEHVAGHGTSMMLRAPTDLPAIGPVLRALPFAQDFLRSDHVPFWDAGLPAVQITDTANFRNPHYHRPSDTPDTLDYEFLADVIAATALALERIAERVPPTGSHPAGGRSV